VKTEATLWLEEAERKQKEEAERKKALEEAKVD
jgi:hypothetical protein